MIGGHLRRPTQSTQERHGELPATQALQELPLVEARAHGKPPAAVAAPAPAPAPASATPATSPPATTAPLEPAASIESVPDPKLSKRRLCKTPDCGQVLSRSKGLYCTEACYVKGCKAANTQPRRCNQPGCSNLSMPGEQSGAKCLQCYSAHKASVRQQISDLGQICGFTGCGNLVHGIKPKYGQYCSLECGRASGKGKPCTTCGQRDVFPGSQSGKWCLVCYNREQVERLHGAKKRRKTEAAAGG